MLDHFNAVHTLPDYEEPVRYAEEEVETEGNEVNGN
jgi:hypothetical protein